MVKLPKFSVRPKVANVKGPAFQVPIANSLAFKLKGIWAADLGLHNYRRFKVGFGPQNTLIVPSTRKNLDREVQSNNFYLVVVVLNLVIVYSVLLLFFTIVIVVKTYFSLLFVFFFVCF